MNNEEPINSKNYRSGANPETPIMNNEILPLSALQARRITDEHALTFQQVCDGVKNISKSGTGYINYIGVEMPMSVIQQVLKAGYSISNSTNPFGENITKISW